MWRQEGVRVVAVQDGECGGGQVVRRGPAPVIAEAPGLVGDSHFSADSLLAARGHRDTRGTVCGRVRSRVVRTGSVESEVEKRAGKLGLAHLSLRSYG
jgi:hypothetical protein